jgi:Ankyrin repeats (3 copies)/Ankyrin repeat
MRTPKFSQRTIESATLLTVGFAMAAAGLCGFCSPIGDLGAFGLHYLGSTLIGAGVLCSFRRATACILVGFVLAAVLIVNPIRTVGTSADETFRRVAEELDALPVESNNYDVLRLCAAIRQKDVAAVREMLATGVDLEPMSGLHDVNKPLAYAAAYGNLEIVKLLVEAGANLNGQVAYGDVALIKADEHGNDDIIEYLISEGADVNVPNDYGVTPFIGLCAKGRLDLVQLAAKHGGDVNSSFVAKIGEGTGTKNFSPLQAAAARGQRDVVEFLLSRGADPRTRDSDGRTLLKLAESKGHEKVAGLLRKKLASANDN